MGCDGWLAKVDYEELSRPIKPKDHTDVLAPLLPQKYSPIRPDGGGNQVYLAEIPTPMAEAVLSLIGRQIDKTLDDAQERQIQNRTNIDATEKYQLVLSRRGQGRYRKNLEKLEVGCRITGVAFGQFLTASHIKPWSKSTFFEKIDGNNGLLLSPHIDRLFDRGYISFQDSGVLLLSPSLPPQVVSAWGLAAGFEQRPLAQKQAVYMSYHRSNIFRSI